MGGPVRNLRDAPPAAHYLHARPVYSVVRQHPDQLLPRRPARNDRHDKLDRCAEDQRVDSVLEHDLCHYCGVAGGQDPQAGHVPDVHHQLAALLHRLDHLYGESPNGRRSWDTKQLGEHRDAVLHLCLQSVLQHGIQCFDIQ